MNIYSSVNSLMNFLRVLRFFLSISARNFSISSILDFSILAAISKAWFLDPNTFCSTFSSIQFIRNSSMYTLDFVFCFIMLQYDRKLYKGMCFNMKQCEALASKRGETK